MSQLKDKAKRISADIWNRRARGIVPFIATDADEVASTIEGLLEVLNSCESGLEYLTEGRDSAHIWRKQVELELGLAKQELDEQRKRAEKAEAELKRERGYRSLGHHAWSARKAGRGMEVCPVEPCAFVKAMAEGDSLAFGVSNSDQVEAGMVWRAAWEDADELMAPLEEKLKRVDHALAVTLADYDWPVEDYDRFFDDFRFYLIPPEPRTLEQIQEDVKRAEQMLIDEIAKHKRDEDERA